MNLAAPVILVIVSFWTDCIRAAITLAVLLLISRAQGQAYQAPPPITIEQENHLTISLSPCPQDITATKFLKEVMESLGLSFSYTCISTIPASI